MVHPFNLMTMAVRPNSDCTELELVSVPGADNESLRFPFLLVECFVMSVHRKTDVEDRSFVAGFKMRLPSFFRTA